MKGTLFAERYRVEKKLGQGSYGTVYLAEDMSGLQGLVALKTPVFEQEIAILSTLSHPSIPSYIASGRCSRDELFLVMELIEAETLETFFEHQARIQLAHWNQLVMQMMEIFLYLQTREPAVYYSDLHFKNVLYSSDTNHVSLVDFGHASQLAPSARQNYAFCDKLFSYMQYYLLHHLVEEFQPPLERWIIQMRQARSEADRVEDLQLAWCKYVETLGVPAALPGMHLAPQEHTSLPEKETIDALQVPPSAA